MIDKSLRAGDRGLLGSTDCTNWPKCLLVFMHIHGDGLLTGLIQKKNRCREQAGLEKEGALSFKNASALAPESPFVKQPTPNSWPKGLNVVKCAMIMQYVFDGASLIRLRHHKGADAPRRE